MAALWDYIDTAAGRVSSDVILRHFLRHFVEASK